MITIFKWYIDNIARKRTLKYIYYQWYRSPKDKSILFVIFFIFLHEKSQFPRYHFFLPLMSNMFECEYLTHNMLRKTRMKYETRVPLPNLLCTFWSASLLNNKTRTVFFLSISWEKAGDFPTKNLPKQPKMWDKKATFVHTKTQ